jgi:long-chain acyl-CoA synthetase
MNVARILERHAAHTPRRVALRFEGRSYTYGELNALAGRAAAALTGLGVQPGDRVALLLPNSPEFVIAYFGMLKLGAIAVALNVMLQRDEISFILNDCGAKTVLTTAELRPRLDRVALPSVGSVLISDAPAERNEDFLWLLQNAPAALSSRTVSPEHPAVILYTSGTTGFPKGATLSHGNLLTTCRAKRHYCGTTPDDRLLLFLPVFHCFGLNAVLTHGLFAGATVVLQRRFQLEAVLRALVEERVTMFFGVPSVYLALLQQRLPQSSLRTVRYSFTAGATMPAEVTCRWQATYGLPLYEGYGLTESSPFASYNHPVRWKPGSVGVPIRGVQMRIVDADGQEAGVGELGEIVIRGPNVMLGYWGRPEESAAVLRGGWLHTGDIGCRDNEGYFAVVDRLKDMVNVSGFKIFPAEVENLLHRHPAVAEVAVYGVPDPLKGEQVRASVVLKRDHRATAEELSAFCHQQIASYKVPRCFEFVAELPKNATGKVLKRILRATAAKAGERRSSHS